MIFGIIFCLLSNIFFIIFFILFCNLYNRRFRIFAIFESSLKRNQFQIIMFNSFYLLQRFLLAILIILKLKLQNSGNVFLIFFFSFQLIYVWILNFSRFWNEFDQLMILYSNVMILLSNLFFLMFSEKYKNVNFVIYTVFFMYIFANIIIIVVSFIRFVHLCRKKCPKL